MKTRSIIALFFAGAVVLFTSGLLATQAATEDISNLAFVNQPSDDLEPGESGRFVVETRNDAGNAEPADTPVDISLDDGGSGGTFFEYANNSCSNTELTNDTVTVGSGSSQADFCYENAGEGSYQITASIQGADGYAEDAQFGAQNVWTNGFAGVWHFQEAPDQDVGTAEITDSTSNQNDGSSEGAMDSSDSTAGKLGGNSLSFDEVDDAVVVPSDSSLDRPDTDWELRGWANTPDNAGSDFQYQVSQGDFLATSSYNFYLFEEDNGSPGQFGFRPVDDNGNQPFVVGGQVSTSNWQHFSLRSNDAASTTQMYIDGSFASSDSVNLGPLTSQSDLFFGGRSDRDPNRYFGGRLDEWRLTQGHSADWLFSEYTNQNTPTTFYTAGASETGSGSGWYGDAWDKRIPVTIQSSQVNSQLTDFPVYVDLSDLGSDLFSTAKADGSDIRITAADGTSELPRELVSFETQNETGELHFRADSVSDTADTTFYVYYGNTGTSESAGVTVASQQASSSEISGIAFVDQPSGDLQQNEKGHFTIETQDDAGNPEPAGSSTTVFLGDAGSGGTFFQYSGGVCSDTELTSDEVTVVSGESQADFCYSNSADGDHSVQASLDDVGGNYAPDEPFGSENVWTEGYRAVWHMNQGDVVDSTANSNDGTNFGSTGADGKFSAARSFDGADDYIRVPNDPTLQFGDGVSFTVSTFLSPDDGGRGRVVNNRGQGGAQEGYQIRLNSGTSTWKVSGSSIDDGQNDTLAEFSPNTYPINEWRHLVMRYESDTKIDFYVNGAFGTEEQGSGTYGSLENSLPTVIGASISLSGEEYTDGSSEQNYHGLIGDIRIAGVLRSPAWLAAENSNQNTPSSFYAVGPRQTESGSSNWYDTDWEYRKPVTVDSNAIDSQLTDFPVYVDLADMGSNFFSDAAVDCGNIRVTTDDGTTERAREIVSCDQSAEAGELHFKADTLADTADSIFYIYYGVDKSATAQVSVVQKEAGSGDQLESRDGGGGEEEDGETDETPQADPEGQTEEEEPDPDEQDRQQLEAYETERGKLYKLYFNALQKLKVLQKIRGN